MTIIDKLKSLGFATINEGFYGKVQEWKSWYEGDVKGFHRYRVRNGAGIVRCKRYTLNMGKKIPEDWANLLMNERVEITLDGTKEQEFIDRVLEENNFRVRSNEMQEMAFALGTVAFIPRVVGMGFTEAGPVPGSATDIIIDYVTVEHIWPLAWQNGIITECAFDNIVNVNGDDYCYLQIHRKVNGLYDIENRLYTYRNQNVPIGHTSGGSANGGTVCRPPPAPDAGAMPKARVSRIGGPGESGLRAPGGTHVEPWSRRERPPAILWSLSPSCGWDVERNTPHPSRHAP